MIQLSLQGIKEIELSILNEIDAICTKNGFRYSLAGGTLLGAIRHKGFIPWDDDIDVAMPRNDYKKFIEFCSENETGFDLVSAETDDRYGYLFAKACDKKTVIAEEFSNPNNIEMGVYVDIFPIDGLGDTYEEAKREFNKTRFQRELLVAKNWTRFFKSRTHAWYYEPIRLAFFVMSRFISSKRLIASIQKRLEKNDFDKCKYVGAVCGCYRYKEIMEHDIYSDYIKLYFENMEFNAIKQYDKYLQGIYGDYMKLPPEEKRVTHHTFKAYKKDTQIQLKRY